ncbi:Retrotransposon gag protein [Corchorus capsularis]|uniref:Retrotransposon gag protein n=1 Tax=Corchorus capsularis TaxID=210143 RepID=A0A1R3GQ96_COCAP|nr:Retrotransposon gag protein [Corchorus capsularis]
MVAANPSCIRLSPAARNYELKQTNLTMIPQFNGLLGEDALAFIWHFVSTVQTFPLFNISEGELFMRAIDLRAKISSFQQKPGEAFHEAWEHFPELLSQCPHHLFSDEFLVQRFYDGLTSLWQSLVDLACNGDYGDKTTDKIELVNRDTKPQAPEACAYCGLYDHSTNGCMNVDPSTMGYEDVNYLGGYAAKDPKNDLFSPTYNPGWRNHPNLSWRNLGRDGSWRIVGGYPIRPNLFRADLDSDIWIWGGCG